MINLTLQLITERNRNWEKMSAFVFVLKTAHITLALSLSSFHFPCWRRKFSSTQRPESVTHLVFVETFFEWKVKSDFCCWKFSFFPLFFQPLLTLSPLTLRLTLVIITVRSSRRTFRNFCVCAAATVNWRLLSRVSVRAANFHLNFLFN